MNEEINVFAEFLIDAKKYFEITDEVFNIINTQPDIAHMTEYLKCAVCGIAHTDILAMSSSALDVNSICAVERRYLQRCIKMLMSCMERLSRQVRWHRSLQKRIRKSGNCLKKT